MKKEVKQFVVFWVGGERDGEELMTSKDERSAVKFAGEFWDAHEGEFDPLVGGIGIVKEYTDGTSDVVEW